MAKATLLVVEDDTHLLNGIRDILELDQYDVMTAQNGKQALEVLQKTNSGLPDLIVSDIMMPYMDGIELLEEVRRHDAWLTIPFIFLTAKGEKTDIQRGKILGVDDYLVKPFDAEDLLIAVDSRLRRHRGLQHVQTHALDDLKRNILTILNHEMRTPLTLVVAYADMLKSFSAEAMTDEELITFLRGVNTGADRLRRLIENFILLVELETGDAAKTYEWRSYNIPDFDTLIKAAHDQVMSGEDVHHTCDVYIDQPLPEIKGDRDYLIIVLRELLDNAVKFSPPDKPIALNVVPKNGEVHIQVTDGGRGIPAEEYENIWKTFYQINRQFYEDQGAGSGLALVQGLVQLHNGWVALQSKVGEGSTFTIGLPIAK